MGNDTINSYKDIIVKNVHCGQYKSKSDVLNLIEYIVGNSKNSEKKKLVRYIGGCGTPYYNSNLCCESFYIIKKYYEKTEKTDKTCRSAYHFIVSFPNFINNTNIVKFIAIDICQNFYEKGFQSIYGIHEDTKNLHIHIAINSTSFMTGKQMHLSNTELKTLIKDLKKIAYKILKNNDY